MALIKLLNLKIEQLLYKVDKVEGRLSILKTFDSASDLFEYAGLYNWDDGFNIPRAIANHPNCDHGTALLLFWLAEPIPYLNGEIENEGPHKNWYEFCQYMESRLKKSHYSIGEKVYRPDLSKVQKHKLIKLGVDPILFSESKKK